MQYEAVAKGLGWFPIALGTVELLAPKRLAEALAVTGHERLIRGFGAREIVAGLGLLQAPAHSAMVWNRVAGDVMDLTALGAAVRRKPDNKMLWGAIAFVAGVTLLDVVTARELDRTTGRFFPKRAKA